MKKNYLLQIAFLLSSILFSEKINAQCIPSFGSMYLYSGTTGHGFTFGSLTSLLNGGPANYYVNPQTGSYIQGLSYPFSFQNGKTHGTSGVAIWIDYNGNNLFSDPGEYVYSGLYTAPSVITGTITIPVTATPGIHTLRICFNPTTIPLATQSCSPPSGFGNYADYHITILSNAACSGTPNAGTTVANTTNPCCGEQVHLSLTGTSGTNAGGALSYQWLKGTNCVGTWNVIPGATHANYSEVPPPGSTLGYRCIVQCSVSGLSDTSSIACVAVQPWSCTSSCYGVSMAYHGGYEEIFNVTMGSLNNTTDCLHPFIGSQGSGTGMLNKCTDFTGSNGVPAPSIYKGMSQTFSIELGGCFSGFSYSSVKIYIDYNHNGNFIDPGEQVYYEPQSFAVLYTGNFIVPPTALTGCTRMRVIARDWTGGVINPTGLIHYGETEDYLVDILNQTHYDPAVTGISATIGTCLSNNETVTATLCNYGDSSINLSTNNVTVTLKVNGPGGIVSYPVTVSSGILNPYGASCIPVTFTGVNLSTGGNYSINTVKPVVSILDII